MADDNLASRVHSGNEVTAIPLHIVSPAYIATAYFFVIAVLVMLVSSFLVRVPVVVEGQGMLMADTEVISYAVMPASDGRLEEFFVKVGDTVKNGQVIARVSILRLENEIEMARLALQDLRHKERLLDTFHKESLAASEGTLKQQRVEAASRHRSLGERLARLDRARDGDVELIKLGFLSARGVDTVHTEREQVEDQIFVSKRQMVEAETNFSELVQRQRREKVELQLQIGTQVRQWEALLDRKKMEGVINSPHDGVVSELLTDLQQPTTRERRVATVTPFNGAYTGKNLVTNAVVFVPAIQGKKLVVGMPTQILPLIYEEQEYGRIEGVVTQISSSTADDDTLMRVFKNQKLVRKLFENEAPYKVSITVATDTRGSSGLSWTSSRGPGRLMDPGTIVSGWIVYNNTRIIYLLLPAVKRISESAWVNALELMQGKPAEVGAKK
ncbi:MAG: NHLP bacteriocin system secretion protein [Rhodospirillales bacterium]|nr:NHLP bacteriocin system secretion protein [Rhodospirillales bacterium]